MPEYYYFSNTLLQIISFLPRISKDWLHFAAAAL